MEQQLKVDYRRLVEGWLPNSRRTITASRCSSRRSRKRFAAMATSKASRESREGEGRSN